jgi:hypothetical protein
VVEQQLVDLLGQQGGLGEVAGPDGPAADLVLIGRADAAAGGADLGVAESLFAGLVQVAVDRQNEGRVLGDLQRLGVSLTPSPSNSRSSSISAQGSRTTPLPMIDSLPLRTTPDGKARHL